MDCIYIAPLSKVLYNLCLSFTHSHTHSHTNGDWLPCKVPCSEGGGEGVRGWGGGISRSADQSGLLRNRPQMKPGQGCWTAHSVTASCGGAWIGLLAQDGTQTVPVGSAVSSTGWCTMVDSVTQGMGGFGWLSVRVYCSLVPPAGRSGTCGVRAYATYEGSPPPQPLSPQAQSVRYPWMSTLPRIMVNGKWTAFI